MTTQPGRCGRHLPRPHLDNPLSRGLLPGSRFNPREFGHLEGHARQRLGHNSKRFYNSMPLSATNLKRSYDAATYARIGFAMSQLIPQNRNCLD